jgi:hypothetical protein
MDFADPAPIGAPAEKQWCGGFRELAELHHALVLEPVGRLPCNEYEQRGGKKLHQPDHAELEGAAGQIVDLPADRHRGDLTGKPRQASRQQKEEE